jgi:hypothetical protein
MSLREKIGQMMNDARPSSAWACRPTIIGTNACTASRAPARRPFSPGHRHGRDVGHPAPARIADVIATEARAKHNDAIHDRATARAITASRSGRRTSTSSAIPRWGRGQETYGEDPFLTARLGVAFITRACRATIRNT